MDLKHRSTRRAFLGLLGKGLLAATAVATVPSLAFAGNQGETGRGGEQILESADNHSETERKVEEILGFDVDVNDFAMLRNGGETIFNIQSPKNFQGYIGFSESYLERNPESAQNDLLAMYELQKSNGNLDGVSLWNAHWNDDNAYRNAHVAHSSIPLEEDWNTIAKGKGLPVQTKESGHETFYLPFPSRELDENVIKYLNTLESSPLKWDVEKLWGLDIDVFKTEADKRWILKGRSSTMLYNPQTEQFYVGGIWDRNTEIKNVDSKARQLLLKEKGSNWRLQMLDTTDNRTCSAYKASMF